MHYATQFSRIFRGILTALFKSFFARHIERGEDPGNEVGDRVIVYVMAADVHVMVANIHITVA